MRARCLSARCPCLHESVEIRRGALGSVSLVVPAAEVQHRGRHCGVATAQLGPIPPRIFGRMGEPLEVVRSFGAQVWHLTQRQEAAVLLRDLWPGLRGFGTVAN